MKVSLVYVYSKNGVPRVDRVYVNPSTATSYAAKLRKRGKDAFIVRRTLRTTQPFICVP